MELEKILKQLLNDKNDGTVYICQSPFLNGIPVKITGDKKLECQNWRLKAVELEHNQKIRKAERKKQLIDACHKVEEKIKKKKVHVESSGFDFNRNVCLDKEPNILKNKSNASQIEDGIIDDAAGNLQHSMTSEVQNLESDLRNNDVDDRASENFVNASKEEAQSIKNTNDESEEENEMLSLRNSHQVSGFAPEVENQIMELLDLQKQQEQLDSWYEDMQKELEIEKITLTEKYDQLRLQNIQKQKSIIEDSEDYLKANVSRCMTPQSKCHTHGDIITSFKTSPIIEESLKEDVGGEIVTTKDNNNDEEQEEEIDTTEGSQVDNLLRNTFDFDYHVNSEKENSDIPQFVDNLTRPENESGSVFEGSIDNIPPKALASELLLQHYRSMDMKLRRKSKAMKFFGTPEKKETSRKSPSSLPESPILESPLRKMTSPEPLLQKTQSSESSLRKSPSERPSLWESPSRKNEIPLSISEPIENHSTVTTSQTPRSAFTKSIIHNEKLNSFAHTPNFSEVDQSISVNKITSTPHDVGEGTPYYNLSDIYADEMPITDFCNEISQREEKIAPSNIFTNTITKLEQSNSRLLAAYHGFMVRRLMQSYKVKEILKTIKDTQMFLTDMNKENGNGKIEHRVSLADRQLRARLVDELSTKHCKLIDIFTMTKKDQWKLVLYDRTQREEKKLNAITKSSVTVNKERPKTASKKLSTASQKSMKRRQESLAKKTRPKTAPEKITITKPESKATTTNNNEGRALKPIQSTSPTIKRKICGNVLLNSLKKPGDKKKKPSRISSAHT